MKYVNDFIDNAAKAQKDILTKTIPEAKYREPLEKVTDFVTSVQKSSYNLFDGFTFEIAKHFNKMYYEHAFK